VIMDATRPRQAMKFRNQINGDGHPSKLRVAGSNPAGVANNIKGLA